jgi:Flp pilus assembly protein TadD
LFGLAVLASGCFLDPSIEQNRTRREALDLHAQALDLENRGDYVQALDLNLKAIDLSPRPAFYYHAGVCHTRLGHEEQALLYFDKALELEPEFELARAERDLVAKRLQIEKTTPPKSSDEPSTSTESLPEQATVETAGERSPARQEAETALPTPTESPREEITAEAVRKVVFPRLYGEGSGTLPAEPFLGKTGEVAEFHFPPEPTDQAGWALSAGRLEQASFYLESLVRENPRDWSLRLRLARLLTRSGRLARAEAELRQAAEIAPEQPEIWYAWGGFYARQERWTDAARCFRECLRIQPDHVKALNNLGVVLLRTGLWQLAEEEFRRLLELNPEFPSAYLNLAIIEYEYHEDKERAVAYAEEYLRLGGEREEEVRRWRQQLLFQKDPPLQPDPRP